MYPVQILVERHLAAKLRTLRDIKIVEKLSYKDMLYEEFCTSVFLGGFSQAHRRAKFL